VQGAFGGNRTVSVCSVSDNFLPTSLFCHSSVLLPGWLVIPGTTRGMAAMAGINKADLPGWIDKMMRNIENGGVIKWLQERMGNLYIQPALKLHRNLARLCRVSDELVS
jgi:hypothetical protein